MANQLKPIKVWGTGGPNPPKVGMILEELGVPYEAESVPMTDIKKPEYLAINPNGRLPSIHDPTPASPSGSRAPSSNTSSSATTRSAS